MSHHFISPAAVVHPVRRQRVPACLPGPPLGGARVRFFCKELIESRVIVTRKVVNIEGCADVRW